MVISLAAFLEKLVLFPLVKMGSSQEMIYEMLEVLQGMYSSPISVDSRSFIIDRGNM